SSRSGPTRWPRDWSSDVCSSDLLAVLHAGWKGLSEGVVEAGVAALGEGAKAAIIGPAIGPCCYDVGPEVARLFEPSLVQEGKLRSEERRVGKSGGLGRRRNSKTQ